MSQEPEKVTDRPHAPNDRTLAGTNSWYVPFFLSLAISMKT